MKTSNIVWIKTHLIKDGTPQWDGVEGDQDAVKAKLNELYALGYHPVIDHSMSDPEPQYYTLLYAEDGRYKLPHSNKEQAMAHVRYQLGNLLEPSLMGGWVDIYGRTMEIIDIKTACQETVDVLETSMVDDSRVPVSANTENSALDEFKNDSLTDVLY